MNVLKSSEKDNELDEEAALKKKLTSQSDELRDKLSSMDFEYHPIVKRNTGPVTEESGGSGTPRFKKFNSDMWDEFDIDESPAIGRFVYQDASKAAAENSK